MLGKKNISWEHIQEVPNIMSPKKKKVFGNRRTFLVVEKAKHHFHICSLSLHRSFLTRPQIKLLPSIMYLVQLQPESNAKKLDRKRSVEFFHHHDLSCY